VLAIALRTPIPERALEAAASMVAPLLADAPERAT